MRDLPIFYAPNIQVDSALPDSEAGHCVRVLRLGIGDKVAVTNGLGDIWEARISASNKHSCNLELGIHIKWHKYWQGSITLCIAPTKAIERMEWLLEKSVEIGVDRIILLRVKHSERKHANKERLERIMLGAMKQSQKALLPTLLTDVDLSEALELTQGSTRYLLHCRAPGNGIDERILIQRLPEGDISLFIGPEGDFTEDEIRTAQSLGAIGTTLGESRLRTETAALSALQWIHTLQMARATLPPN